MICPKYLEAGLERAFRHISDRQGSEHTLPNAQLKVQAVGFRWWNGCCLGALISPSSLLLLLLPQEGDEWQSLQIGETIRHHFPAGSRTFTIAEASSIGRYQESIIDTPIDAFPDQDSAVKAALFTLNTLFGGHDCDAAYRTRQGKPSATTSAGAEATHNIRHKNRPGTYEQERAVGK